MAVKSLAQSSILQPSTTKSMLAGYESNYFHHLETVRLGGSAASVTFSNLARYSDYQHLQVRMITRTNRSNIVDGFFLFVNGDTGNNYSNHYIRGNGSNVLSLANTSYGKIWDAEYTTIGNTGVANAFSPCVIEILDPFETTKNTTFRYFGSSDPTYHMAFASGLWMNTAAVTTLQFAPSTGTAYLAGSRFSLYGLKARA